MKQKRFATINLYERGFAPVIILLFVVVLGAIGFYSYQKYNSQKVGLISFSPTTSASQLTAGDTSNWKTYTSKEYGFSFNYPQGWIIGSEAPDLRFFINSDEIRFSEGGESNPGNEQLTVLVKKPDTRSIQQAAKYYEDANSFLEDYKVTISKIGNLDALYFSNTKNIFILGSDKGIVFAPGPNNKIILDQILSTFKFLDPLTNCSSDTVGISINNVPIGWTCSENEAKDLVVENNKNLSLVFIKSLGTDYFPTDCPEIITNLQIGDFAGPIKLCKKRTSGQWEILAQVVFDRTKTNGAIPYPGMFYISMNTSRTLTTNDKNDLRSILNSVKLKSQ